jgi:hypothetical protein
MRIVIDNLTRMKGQHICVAGIDLESGEHVRPIIVRSRFDRNFLKCNGGPLDVSAIMRLGNITSIGTRPEIEDYSVNLEDISFVELMEENKFWRLLETSSAYDLHDIFGDDLKQRRRGYAVNLGKGKASLGCLAPKTQPSLGINGWGKIRLQLMNGIEQVDLSVTDLRLYKEDNATPRKNKVEEVARRVDKGTKVILCVGLARAFCAKDDTEERHWLQVNGIHLEDEPGWRIGDP